LAGWPFDAKQPMSVKRTFRRAALLLSRLWGNMCASVSALVLARGRLLSDVARGEQQWLEGLYLDTPEEWDDPYRFFRW
jgi:hypothetical protein